ncbi:MAG: hypothetical protein PHT40_00965 [Patescibacteria group bacterium]|nr:hypothetical protein [Patescibacteria group bacterium]
MILYINTTASDKIILALADKTGSVLKFKKIKAPHQQSEKLLFAIEKLLNYQITRLASCLAFGSPRRTRSKRVKLSGVIIVSGPGGFTSLRIGIATANALAWACQIPIIGIECNHDLNHDFNHDKDLIKKGAAKLAKIRGFKQVLPKYGQEPNIGKNKK